MAQVTGILADSLVEVRAGICVTLYKKSITSEA
jgi:hypothetical protein